MSLRVTKGLRLIGKGETFAQQTRMIGKLATLGMLINMNPMANASPLRFTHL